VNGKFGFKPAMEFSASGIWAPANLIVLNRNGEMLFRDLLTVADCGFRFLEERGAKSDTQQGFPFDMLAPFAF
jgi:hypothetical protein